MYRPPETIHLAGPTPVATPWLPWLWLEDDLSAPRHSCAEFIPGDSRPRASRGREEGPGDPELRGGPPARVRGC